MINIDSNCSRVDAVKASANQLKMQVDQTPRTPGDQTYRKAQSQLQALDSDIKSGNAQKAETTLSTAKSTVQQLQTQSNTATKFQRGLNAYA